MMYRDTSGRKPWMNRPRKTLDLDVIPDDPQGGVTAAEGEDASVMGVPVRTIRRLSAGSTKGAPLLRGNSLVAHGTASPALGAGVAVAVPFFVAEPAWLERLVIEPQAGTADLFLTDLRHLNDPLISGEVPAALFAGDSIHNPLIGRYQDVPDPLVGTFRSSAGILASVWNAAISAGAKRGRPGQRGAQPDLRPAIMGPRQRSLIAIGSARAVVGAGALATLAFPIVEEGVIDRLVLEGDPAGLFSVEGITYDNDPLMDAGARLPIGLFMRNSWSSPRFGQYVQGAHILTVVVRNNSAGNAAIGGAFTVR